MLCVGSLKIMSLDYEHIEIGDDGAKVDCSCQSLQHT
jgi:hypothetical protein